MIRPPTTTALYIFLCLFIYFLMLPTPTQALTHVIDYTSAGFSPTNLMVKLTDSIRIRNATDTTISLTTTNISLNTDSLMFSAQTINPQESINITATAVGEFIITNRQNRQHVSHIEVVNKTTLLYLTGKLYESDSDSIPTASDSDTLATDAGQPVSILIDESASSDTTVFQQTQSFFNNFHYSSQYFLIASVITVYLLVFMIFLLKG